MRLITFFQNGAVHPGLQFQGRAISLIDAAQKLGKTFCPTLEDLIWERQQFEPLAREIDRRFRSGDFAEVSSPFASLQLLAPISRPNSCRDGYAFRQHVQTARRNRNVPMIPEFDQYPVFYFTNHNSILGPGPVPCMADHFEQLDFELEWACIVGTRGRNIRAEHAEDFIFGFTILNDLSARRLQMEEMLLNLGPAKGKDFANTIGPVLLTLDELDSYKVPGPTGHIGHNWQLDMLCRVNGKQVSHGNTAQMDWTFAEILERCAYGADIFPTDLIGSGTVGTGCFMELNGTAKLENPDAKPQWLQPGDIVELELTEFGILSNTVELESDFSILARKHLA